MTRTPTLIRKIYALVDQLETKHPGRHFTPDGHMVGSLGEAYAEETYGLTLLFHRPLRRTTRRRGRR